MALFSGSVGLFNLYQAATGNASATIEGPAGATVPERLAQLDEDFDSAPEGFALQGADWMVLAETEAPLNHLQKDLGGKISAIS